MENQNERVFAYQLAKTIQYEDLSNVSGGEKVGVNTSHRETLFPSGGYPGSMDARLDISVDW